MLVNFNQLHQDTSLTVNEHNLIIIEHGFHPGASRQYSGADCQLWCVHYIL